MRIETLEGRIQFVLWNFEITLEELAAKIECNSKEIEEISDQNPNDSLINKICNEFTISKKWMMQNKGEVFSTAAKVPPLERIKQENNVTLMQMAEDLGMKTKEVYAELKKAQPREDVLKLAKQIYNNKP